MTYSALSSSVRRGSRYGFSLVELLVVIAVIGIMAAIAVPVLSPVAQRAHVNKSQRNAQALVAMAGSAQAAGATLDLSSLDAVILQLKGGVTGSGSFSSSTFKVAPFTEEEVTAISEYITISDNSLVFNQN